MKNKVIECQRGLTMVREFLTEKGYECFMEGEKNLKADVLLVNIPDAEWEELNSTTCMVSGDKEKLVINVSAVKLEEIEHLIETSICKF